MMPAFNFYHPNPKASPLTGVIVGINDNGTSVVRLNFAEPGTAPLPSVESRFFLPLPVGQGVILRPVYDYTWRLVIAAPTNNNFLNPRISLTPVLVVNGSGAPVDDALLVVTEISTGRLAVQGLTDSNGGLTLNLADGQYVIVTSKDALAVTVNSGNLPRRMVTIVLAPPDPIPCLCPDLGPSEFRIEVYPAPIVSTEVIA